METLKLVPNRLFDHAEKAVADSPELLLRVQKERLALMHAEVQLGYGDVNSRIAKVYKMREIALRWRIRFFADFGELPTQEYLPSLITSLEKERATLRK